MSFKKTKQCQSKDCTSVWARTITHPDGKRYIYCYEHADDMKGLFRNLSQNRSHHDR